MNLYRIDFVHFSPKDSEKGIKCYLLAKNEEDVFNYIDEKFNYGLWKDQAEDMENEPDVEDRTFQILDEHYNEIGRESYKDHLIRVKGMMNSDHMDTDDAYYGVTHYGWSLVTKSILPAAMIFLIDNNIAEKLEAK